MRVQGSFSENVYRYYQQSQRPGRTSFIQDLSDAFDREIRCGADPKGQILADYCDWKSQ